MSSRGWLWLAVAALYLLHNDFWLWDDPRFLFGLPVGLTYHIAFCGAAALLMWGLVRTAWPRGESGEGEP